MGRAMSHFTFGAIDLSEVVYVNDVPYATREAIGSWLEYAQPQNAIDRLITRHPSISNYALQLPLVATDQRTYDIFVYSPLGCLLLVLASAQPKAKAIKAEMAATSWKELFGLSEARCAAHSTSDSRAELPADEKLRLLKLRSELVFSLLKTSDATVRKALLAALYEVSQPLGMGVPDVSLLGKDIDQLAAEA